jgi:hypothetical protein
VLDVLAAPHAFERAAAGRLALLRIGYAACLAHDVGDLWQHAALWYGEPTWPMTAPAGVRWALGGWWLSLALLGLGVFTRAAALANWGFCVVFLGFHSMRHGYEYHTYNLYMLLAAGLVVLPTARGASLDALHRPARIRSIGPAGELFVRIRSSSTANSSGTARRPGCVTFHLTADHRASSRRPVGTATGCRGVTA